MHVLQRIGGGGGGGGGRGGLSYSGIRLKSEGKLLLKVYTFLQSYFVFLYIFLMLKSQPLFKVNTYFLVLTLSRFHCICISSSDLC